LRHEYNEKHFSAGPGIRTIQRPIEFECAWTVPIMLQLLAEVAWQSLAADAGEMPLRSIEQIRSTRRQLRLRLNAPVVDHLTAERPKIFFRRRGELSDWRILVSATALSH